MKGVALGLLLAASSLACKTSARSAGSQTKEVDATAPDQTLQNTFLYASMFTSSAFPAFPLNNVGSDSLNAICIYVVPHNANPTSYYVLEVPFRAAQTLTKYRIDYGSLFRTYDSGTTPSAAAFRSLLIQLHRGWGYGESPDWIDSSSYTVAAPAQNFTETDTQNFLASISAAPQNTNAELCSLHHPNTHQD